MLRSQRDRHFSPIYCTGTKHCQWLVKTKTRQFSSFVEAFCSLIFCSSDTQLMLLTFANCWINIMHIGTRAEFRPLFFSMTHTAALTGWQFNEMHWTAPDHPPFSPNLLPCDFCLDHLKMMLKVKEFVFNWFLTQPTSFYDTRIRNFPSYGKKCISITGRHVEQ